MHLGSDPSVYSLHDPDKLFVTSSAKMVESNAHLVLQKARRLSRPPIARVGLPRETKSYVEHAASGYGRVVKFTMIPPHEIDVVLVDAVIFNKRQSF